VKTPRPSVDGSGTVVDRNLRRVQGDGKLLHKLNVLIRCVGSGSQPGTEREKLRTDTLEATATDLPRARPTALTTLAVHPYRVVGASRPSKNHVFISPFPFTNMKAIITTSNERSRNGTFGRVLTPEQNATPPG
jgi:hypothetical protein